MSNVLGTIPPFARIAEAAACRSAQLVVADGAQAVPHLPVDVTELGCDFLAFSAHKMLGPTGIGVLWGRRELLEAMPPFLGGGGMIRDVRKDGFVPSTLPWKFEAGTPPIAEAVGMGAAVDYLSQHRDAARHRPRHAADRLRGDGARRALRQRPDRSSDRRAQTTVVACSRSPSKTYTLTTSRRFSTSQVYACVRATTAPSR